MNERQEKWMAKWINEEVNECKKEEINERRMEKNWMNEGRHE